MNTIFLLLLFFRLIIYLWSGIFQIFQYFLMSLLFLDFSHLYSIKKKSVIISLSNQRDCQLLAWTCRSKEGVGGQTNYNCLFPSKQNIASTHDTHESKEQGLRVRELFKLHMHKTHAVLFVEYACVYMHVIELYLCNLIQCFIKHFIRTALKAAQGRRGESVYNWAVSQLTGKKSMINKH